MPGDPLLHVNADARDLPAACPDTGESRVALGGNREDAERVDQRLLECAEVPVQVLLVCAKIENRIADQLARAVKRDVAAALDLKHLDASGS